MLRLTGALLILRKRAPISGELGLGGRYQFEGNAGGTITRCEPPQHLAVTWEYGAEVSWVNVTLTRISEERTRLQLEHVAHVDDNRWNQFGPGAVGVGWDLGLLGLDRYLLGQPSAGSQEIAAWSVSAEGKHFMQASSEAWAKASIAGGEEPSQAAAAAARTTDFYTGSSGQPGT